MQVIEVIVKPSHGVSHPWVKFVKIGVKIHMVSDTARGQNGEMSVWGGRSTTYKN